MRLKEIIYVFTVFLKSDDPVINNYEVSAVTKCSCLTKGRSLPSDGNLYTLNIYVPYYAVCVYKCFYVGMYYKFHSMFCIY